MKSKSFQFHAAGYHWKNSNQVFPLAWNSSLGPELPACKSCFSAKRVSKQGVSPWLEGCCRFPEIPWSYQGLEQHLAHLALTGLEMLHAFVLMVSWEVEFHTGMGPPHLARVQELHSLASSLWRAGAQLGMKVWLSFREQRLLLLCFLSFALLPWLFCTFISKESLINALGSSAQFEDIWSVPEVHTFSCNIAMGLLLFPFGFLFGECVISSVHFNHDVVQCPLHGDRCQGDDLEFSEGLAWSQTTQSQMVLLLSITRRAPNWQRSVERDTTRTEGLWQLQNRTGVTLKPSSHGCSWKGNGGKFNYHNY